MSFREHIKIFPLLIFVAMLSMAVRMGEVVTGVSHMSASAFAESAKHAEEKHEEHEKETTSHEKEDKHASEEHADKAEMKKGDGADEDEAPKMLSAKEKEIIWRDSNDSDLSTTTVKMEMFEDLSKRRETLDNRERDISTREALLQAAEQELERKYQELETIREEIKDLLKEQSEEEEQSITRLVKTYEGMKAKDAAKIFDTLDLDILVRVMNRMSERKLSPILASMNPERARTVTIMMAEQKKLPELPLNN